MNFLRTGSICAGITLVLAAGASLAQDPQREEGRQVGPGYIAPAGEQRAPLPPPAGLFTLPPDSLVRVRLLVTLDSHDARSGDAFPYEVAQDSVVNGFLCFRQGTHGTGIVTHARRAGIFGRNGKMEINFGAIPTTAGNAAVALSPHAVDFNSRDHLAAGVALGSLLVLGPVGVVAGLFIHGDNIVIPAGSEFYVATVAPLYYPPPPVVVR